MITVLQYSNCPFIINTIYSHLRSYCKGLRQTVLYEPSQWYLLSVLKRHFQKTCKTHSVYVFKWSKEGRSTNLTNTTCAISVFAASGQKVRNKRKSAKNKTNIPHWNFIHLSQRNENKATDGRSFHLASNSICSSLLRFFILVGEICCCLSVTYRGAHAQWHVIYFPFRVECRFYALDLFIRKTQLQRTFTFSDFQCAF